MYGSNRVGAAVAVLGALVAGCPQGAEKAQPTRPSVSEPMPARPTRAEKPGNPAPDSCGRYAVPKSALPERHGCKVDADCQWTERRPGDCTGPLCSDDHRAGSKAWVEAVNALHRRVCTRKYSPCVRVRCRIKTPERAVCRAGKCELVFPE